MIRHCQCPACGAKVEFRASTTLLAVCEYCLSTLIRTDVDVENIGKMADLLPDSSLLQIGTQGSHHGMSFSVIGRVQYQHTSGIWNEWHLLFSNGNTGWLSEASGTYVVSFLSASGTPDLTLEQYKLDLSVPILGQRLSVVSIEQARCIAGQGELPFKINSGFDVSVVDLSNASTFASLDFSETPPLLFLGEVVELGALALTHLAPLDQATLKAKAKSFNCPSCAAPVQANLTSSKTIVCNSCTAILDISNKNVELLVRTQKALSNQIVPTIALGSVGQFEGVAYTVTGYIRQMTKSDGLYYYWNEYLLHHHEHGFRWLISAQGHWTFAQPLQKAPRESKSYPGNLTAFHEKSYKHFALYTGKVVQVMGEFYWRVQIVDQTSINDFVSPPSILSKERTQNEITWTVGEYITPDEVEAAFKNTFSLPAPTGIGANQPSPYQAESSGWLNACIFFAVLAFVLQILFATSAENRVLLDTSAMFQKESQPAYMHNNLRYSDYPLPSDKTVFESPVFEVKGRPSNLMIEQAFRLDNSWLATDVALVEQNSGVVYRAVREAAYYSGYDSDGSWVEDNSRQEIIFDKIPAGRYYLKIEADSEWSDGSKAPVNDFIKVSRDVPQWSNLWILLGFVFVWPLIFYYLSYRFEVKRWADSDHPMVESV